MNKRARSRVLILAGAVCFLFAITLTGYNLWDTQRASESVEKTVEEISVRMPEKTLPAKIFSSENLSKLDAADPEIEVPFYVLNPEIEMLEEEIDGTAYIGVLELPALELTLPVISRWNEENGRIAPCRYAGSAYSDDLVICAHNYTGHFGRLSSLSVGDEIRFTDMEGNLFSYTVSEFEVIDGKAIEDMHAGEWDLTLFTCTMSGTARITVRCEKTNE